MLRRIFFVLVILCSPMAEAADIDVHITPTLVAETGTPVAGKPTTLAIAMHPQPGWHGYWKNPGDAGVETQAQWTAPEGVRFGALQYPVPQTLLIAGLMNHVYETDYAALVPVDVPAGLAPGTRLPITLNLQWLACNPSTCVPEARTLSLTLAIGDGTPDPRHAASFDRWRAALPRSLGAPAHFDIDKSRLRLELPLPAAAQVSDAHLFLTTDKVIDYAAPQSFARDGDRLVIETVAKAGAAPSTIDGIVKTRHDRALAFTATPAKVAPVEARADTAEASGAASTIALALGGAILGGLLLNVMPCVFPVLSIKALSLARSGGSPRAARIEAMAYTAGVVSVCAALGALLLALRSAGHAAGWAFQLQDVRIIILLLLLTGAIALNLAGLFELPMITGGDRLTAKAGATGAFWTGALAAFIATPCSGPFMGTALGVALILPPWAAIAIFAGLGLGLALPFLAIGFSPALRRRLPKPGAWTDRLRRLLSLPMFATALGLAWIAGRQAGVDAMTYAVGATLLLGLGLWRVGRHQLRLDRHSWAPLVPVLAALIAVVVLVPRHGAQASGPIAPAASGHEPFDPARLAALRREGRPVLLYFTADWCLTCKVNEKVAIDRSEVAHAFATRNVAVMVGDWTNGDAAISHFLNDHGRSGVPFYLFYPAGGASPRELPQVLTPGTLTALL